MRIKVNIRSNKKIKYRMTSGLEKYLKKVEEDIKNNRNIAGPFYSAEEADRYLDCL